jgi:alkylation response protein AidB-like acyl-CoA dehydrogenase
MQFSLSQPQQELRDSVVRFAREQLQDDVAQRDRDQEFPRELWNRCGTWRMQGLAVPAEQGGKGLDPLHTAVALEGLGYGCPDSGLVFSIAAQLLSCVVPIWKHGSPAQRSQVLPQLCDGRLVAVHGMTEPASGSDAFHMAMRAEPEGDGFRLQGVKTMATNGPVADLALVYAMTNAEKGYFGGVTAFLVEMQTAGLSVGANREKSWSLTTSTSHLPACWDVSAARRGFSPSRWIGSEACCRPSMSARCSVCWIKRSNMPARASSLDRRLASSKPSRTALPT